ncbi:hypothetical protein D3C73_1536570 [compost metagenome]
MKLPPLGLRIAPCSLPFRQPLTPVLTPFRLRLNFYEHRLGIVIVGMATQAVIDKEIGSICVGPAI